MLKKKLAFELWIEDKISLNTSPFLLQVLRKIVVKARSEKAIDLADRFMKKLASLNLEIGWFCQLS